MDENRKISVKKIRILLILVIAASFVVSLFSFIYPMLRKSAAVENIGRLTTSELGAFTIALSHYSAAGLEEIRSNPAITPEYKSIAGLLARVRAAGGYQRLYLITRESRGKYLYAVDSAYRDNAVAGTEYFAPGTAYQMDVYQAGKSAIESVFSGKTASATAGDIVTFGLEPSVVTYLPVRDASNNVIALLGADRDPGDVSYHVVGFVDLSATGVFFLLLGVAGVLVWYLLGRCLIRRKIKEDQKNGVLPIAAGKSGEAEEADPIRDDEMGEELAEDDPDDPHAR